MLLMLGKSRMHHRSVSSSAVALRTFPFLIGMLNALLVEAFYLVLAAAAIAEEKFWSQDHLS